MKETLELPDALMREIKMRAEHEGRPITDVVADLLASSLAREPDASPENGRVMSKNLPLIKVRPAQPADARKLSPQEGCDWLKDVDLQLEVERYEKALGHQHVDRADG